VEEEFVVLNEIKRKDYEEEVEKGKNNI